MTHPLLVAPDVRDQIFCLFLRRRWSPKNNLERQRSKEVPSITLEGTITQADALPISMKEHMGRSVERARGSFFPRVFENALQTDQGKNFAASLRTLVLLTFLHVSAALLACL